jgi:Ca-activated chloride channel family protein
MERTQDMGADPGATQMLGADPQRTAMADMARAIAVEAQFGTRYGLATEPWRENLLVLLRSTGMMGGRRPAMNLCLLIDRSGSMEGEPLDYVKRAASYVVDLMDQNDVLSIVAFAEDVRVVMPARRVMNKQLIKEHIMRLEVGNTTNIYDGLVVAGQQVAAIRSDKYINRILFLSDGDPTTGIKDFASIVGKAAENKEAGVTVTALGFGPEYNEELIAGIARRCGGNYYYITRPDLIPEVFRKELDQVMNVTSQNIRMNVTVPKLVRVRQIYGSQPTYSGRTATVALPDLERGATMSNLIELDFTPRPTGTYRIAQVEILYEDLTSGRQERIGEDVVLEFIGDRAQVEQSKNPIVQRELELAIATRSLEKTMMGIKTQQIAQQTAMMELTQAKTIMLQQGRTKEAGDLDEAIAALQRGEGGVEKTLIGTIMDLDAGKKS